MRAKNLIGAFAQIVRGRNAQGLASIISQRETYLRVRERIVRDKIRKVVAFGGFGAEKFSARRRVEEKIAYADGCSARMSGIFHITHATAVDGHPRTSSVVFRVGH